MSETSKPGRRRIGTLPRVEDLMRLAGLLVFAVSFAAASAGLPDKVSELSWLAGSWEGDDAGTWNEEVWAAPRGGLMLAFHRDTGRSTGFEFLRIEETPAGLVYRAMPGGRPATDFKLVEAGPARAVFESALEFPRRVVYWREGEGLHARIEGVRAGKPASREWTWQRADAEGRKAAR
jgi:hypothetical protein